ncbi:hypothetical protein BCR35DRAFT_307949 [Leucosporidium creatinivorum]|uniref:Uncharacterized protein n=1 Tax=Leucosporidium creatinivorum TaxID=106004 RepID=A0A1Y2EGE0_9BASI|nr:hypothetical protein BCR35DRAFT_307949 [Leucosporidium creatinivorum]
MPFESTEQVTQKSLKLILPAPAELDACSNSSRPSSPSPSPSATHSSPVSPNSPSSPPAKYHRRASIASSSSTPSSTLSIIWQPLSALPSPPALSDVVASAFFALEETSGETTASDSGVWADVEDSDDEARRRRVSRSRVRKGKRFSSVAPTAVLAFHPPNPLLLAGTAKSTLNASFSGSTFIQPRDPRFGIASPTPSSSSARRPPRIRGAPVLYRQDRIRPCTCGAEFEDSSTTTSSESEEDEQSSEEEEGRSSVGVGEKLGE